MPDFGTYEGRPVRKSSLTIRGTGDGLSDALAIEPRTFQPTETAWVVLEVEMSDVDFKYMRDGDVWNRVQVCKAIRGAFMDEALAKPILDDIAVAVEAQRVEEGGDVELGLTGELAVGRIAEHRRGTHKRKRKDCAMCFPFTDEDHARLDEWESEQRAAADGGGDNDNPLPAARKRRTKK